MSSINTSFLRTTSLMASNTLLATLRQTQSQLLTLQQQISTGKAVSVPSDAPASVSAIQLLQKSLENRTQYQNNLTTATNVLNNTDGALANASTLLVQAASIASNQIGANSDAATRVNQASIIDSSLDALVSLANQTTQGVPLFGGNALGGSNVQSFVSFLGGIRYVGSNTNLAADVGTGQPLGFNSNGQDSFNAVQRIPGVADLDPQATEATDISAIGGAQGQGVRSGSLVVTVNSTAITVDLADAQNLGDVVTRVNHAIDSVQPGAGTLAVSGAGLALTAAGGNTVGIGELGSGKTAGDLGINISSSGATTAGADINPKLTLQTTLASLGASVDLTSGLKITQGTTTKIADFSACNTIQDMANVVDQLGLGLKLQINQAGNGVDLIDEVSGLSLSVGENAGGTTATDLGLRTFGLTTTLSSFNNGLGVDHTAGEADFEVDLHNGTTFQVNLDGVSTVQDLVNKISAAATTAGLTVGTPGQSGTGFNIGLASDGNGLVFEDKTAGSGDFKVVQLGTSLAATDLGIYTNAGSGGTIAGADVAKVQVDSAFTHLINLRDSLQQNDSRGITLAGGKVQTDNDNVIRARADVGVRAQRATQIQSLSQEQGISEQSLLSQLQDTDMATAITKFTQLQQQLQASLQVGAQNLQKSLLDYLQ